MPAPSDRPTASALDVLRDVFGYESFRPFQAQAIDSALRGRDSLVILPTGGGKSLCYQIPARIFSGFGSGEREEAEAVVVVVSPLIALMKDQVDAAVKKGMKACYVNSSLSADERAARYRALRRRKYELVYVTPERFRNSDFREALSANRIGLLAIDEAHCISQWGHDFRPDYSRLGDVRRDLGSPLTMALTATATAEGERDVIAQLGLGPDELDVYRESVRRDNLELATLDVHGLDDKVRAFVFARHQARALGPPGAEIAYFSLIQTLREFSDRLSRLSIPHLVYHGQLSDRERRRAQDAFIREEAPLALATPAFGLGVDKPNVRLVAHAEIPGSVEAYAQEIGRAGRDGAPASCVLFFDPDDVAIQADFAKWANPDPGFVQAVYNLIERNPLRVRSEGFEFLRGQMNYYNRRDFRVETSVNLLERWGSIEGRSPREWKAVAPPSNEWMREDLHRARSRALARKLAEMAEFAEAKEGCRVARVQAYFGERDAPACGRCDLCRAGAEPLAGGGR